MTYEETGKLLAICASCDRRTVGDADVLAWHLVLGDLPYADCETAVTAHYGQSREWIMPADVRARVKSMRRDRLERALIPAPSAQLTDEPGRYIAALSAHIAQIAGSRSVRRAITAPVRDDGPPEVFIKAREALGRPRADGLRGPARYPAPEDPAVARRAGSAWPATRNGPGPGPPVGAGACPPRWSALSTPSCGRRCRHWHPRASPRCSSAVPAQAGRRPAGSRTVTADGPAPATRPWRQRRPQATSPACLGEHQGDLADKHVMAGQEGTDEELRQAAIRSPVRPGTPARRSRESPQGSSNPTGRTPAMTEKDLIRALRGWVDDSITDANVRAAVRLLIEHGHWLTDEDFTRACISDDHPDYSWIDWAAARVFAESNPNATIAELAMLRLIVDLGSDRYRFSRHDTGNIALAKRAFSEAAGR